MLFGLVVVIVEGVGFVFIIDVRSYLGRNLEEFDIEKVVRGVRDGFVENIVVNMVFFRWWIRDECFCIKMIKVGE